ncbi:hypothetical protein L6164_010241 [Bauhinia variegata]|uniref:Uncharacterized protein n=1 Tax=Bauhinia variegata TaxID=167791 RepID=A0ACB9PQ15_BAUVA|nr:hypothetical protein L6164_010241 [Bauhinia variegata]
MDAETHARYAQNGEVMLASAILLFFVILTIIFLRTFGHFCIRHRRHSGRFYPRIIIPNTSSVRAANTFTAAYSKPLEFSILKLLPTFTYSSVSHPPMQECAVCLSEFEDDDEGRVLPSCNHAFHSQCIDTWFLSHSNCPLCRAPVRPPKIGPVVDPIRSPFDSSQAGCSTLPPPIGCPRKPLDLVEMVGVIVELPSAPEKRRT